MTAIRRKIAEEAYAEMTREDSGEINISRGRMKSNEQLVEESVAAFKQKLQEIIAASREKQKIHNTR